jgi:hypothetical protein
LLEAKNDHDRDHDPDCYQDHDYDRDHDHDPDRDPLPMPLAELVQQKAFIGKEFLTWLWHRSETAPAFDLPRGRTCEIEMLDPIVLDAHFGDARSTALKGGSPATSPEARAALLEGKKLRRARIKLSSDGVDWIATLDGETMATSGLNLPRPGQLPFEEALRLRMEFAMEFESLIEELLDRFLTLRLDAKEWAPELKKIQAWIESK